MSSPYFIQIRPEPKAISAPPCGSLVLAIMEAAAPIKAILNGKPVTIVDDNPSGPPHRLVRGTDQYGHEFNVPHFKLKFPKPKAPEAVYVSQAVPASMQDFVAYLKSVTYNLRVNCRTGEQEEQAKRDWAMWTATPENPAGEDLPSKAIRQYNDRDDFPLCWCLDFPYDPSIDYPFSILDRGTGGRKPSASGPVAWLKPGSKNLEVRYTETVELVVRGGIRVQ